jgi:hypothetical protein
LPGATRSARPAAQVAIEHAGRRASACNAAGGREGGGDALEQRAGQALSAKAEATLRGPTLPYPPRPGGEISRKTLRPKWQSWIPEGLKRAERGRSSSEPKSEPLRLSEPCVGDRSRFELGRPTDRARLCRRNRRSLPRSPIPRLQRLFGGTFHEPEGGGWGRQG